MATRARPLVGERPRASDPSEQLGQVETVDLSDLPGVAAPLPRSLRTLALGYLILGVPALLGLQLATGSMSTLLPLSIGAMMLPAAFTPWPRLFEAAPYRRFLFLFLVLGAATGLRFFTGSSGDAREQAIELGQCFLWLSPFLAVPFFIADEFDGRRAWQFIDAAGVGVTISLFGSYIALQQWGLQIGEVLIEEGAVRSFGPFGDQVGFTIMLFGLVAAARHKLSLALLHGGAVMFTATRGAFIALLIGGLWLVWLETRSAGVVSLRRRTVRSALLLAVGLAAFLASPLGETALDRVLAVRVTMGSVAQRFAAMQLGLEVAADHPVGGVGYLGFRRQSEAYRFDRMAALGPDPERGAFTAQNQFVQTATDAGLPGLMVLIGLLISLYVRFSRAAESRSRWASARARGLAACVIAMAIGNQGAVWILPAAITGYVFFLVASIHLRTLAVEGRRPVAVRRAYRSTLVRR